MRLDNIVEDFDTQLRATLEADFDWFAVNGQDRIRLRAATAHELVAAPDTPQTLVVHGGDRIVALVPPHNDGLINGQSLTQEIVDLAASIVEQGGMKWSSKDGQRQVKHVQTKGTNNDDQD